MAVESPSEAASSYIKGLESLERPDKGNSITEKLKTAVLNLSSEDAGGLLENEENEFARGHIMLQLGAKSIEDGKYEEALEILTKLIEQHPEHESVEKAGELIKGLDAMPAYSRRTIGCLLPLSGSHKVFGNKALRGIELALAESMGDRGASSINIIVKDTGSDPRKAVRGVMELSDARVSAIIGPIITAVDAAQEAQDRGIPIITLTQKSKITEIGDYVFRNFLTPKMQVETLITHAMEALGLSNFAILYPDEKYGTTFMNLFWDAVMKRGGKVVGVEPYGLEQTDFSEPIKKLVGRYYGKKNAKSIVDFDAIFIPDEPKKVGLIIPQLAFYDIDNVTLLGTNIWHSGKLVRMAGRFAQGAIIPEGFFEKASSEVNRRFVRKYKETYGDKPGFTEAAAYDTAHILFRILEKPGVRFRSTLRKSLANTKNYPGVTGVTSFSENGEAEKKLYLLRLKGKEFVEIDEWL